MQNQKLTVATAFIVATLVLGCNSSPTAPRQSDQASGLDSVTGDAKGGGGGGGKPGGITSMNVAMAGGVIVASQAVPVQNDSRKELNLQGEMTGVSTLLSGTKAGACVVMDGDPEADHSALVALLETGPLNPFRVVVIIDKTAIDAVSDKHRVTLNWDNPDPDGGTLIVNLTEDVTVEQTGNEYEFSGGFVRIQDKRGRKDSVLLKCPNGGDTVTVTVSS